MIIRNSKFKQIIPDNFTYKGTKYTKAYYKDEILFAYTDDDYAYQYFTIESLEDGNVITLTIGSGVTSTQMTSISYSTDNGYTWNTTTVDSTTQTINVNLDKGEKVLWKGVGNALAASSALSSSSIFSSTYNFIVYGNIMSLLKGDNFVNDNTVSTTRAFAQLFYYSAKLIDASNLMLTPTTLVTSCYEHMFDGCTSLVKGPKLPATTLANYCYRFMFTGCTSLIEAPELNVTTLKTGCYRRMFDGCTSLVKAPELPATTLVDNCYSLMFAGCTSLIEAPELSATTLASACYQSMFSGCTSLNYIKCLATDISATDCTTDWVKNVAPTGTFIKADNMSSWVIDSNNGIPIGWTLHNYENCTVTLTVNDSSYGNTTGAGTYHTGEFVTIKANATDGYRFVGWYDGSTLVSENEAYTFQIWTDVIYQAVFASGQVDYSTQYFTIESLEDNNSITLVKSDDVAPEINAYYSLDNGTTWTQHATSAVKTWVLNTGDKLLIKATANAWAVALNKNYFTSTKQFDVYGNIMSLLYGDNFANQVTLHSARAFSQLFVNANKLKNAENLILPATNLTEWCYENMFYGCTSLVTVPELPATTLANYCYEGMFMRCTSLKTAPTLPATTLADYCYQSMFTNCTALVTAPALPATTLANSCYVSMFASCTSLVTAPALPATTLAYRCYASMFQYCTSLVTAPALPATTLANYCYYRMFYECASLYTAPQLPATTLTQACYYDMFYHTRIYSIKIYAVAYSWPPLNFGTVLSATGTYYVKRNAGSSILNACPSGWTISKTL